MENFYPQRYVINMNHVSKEKLNKIIKKELNEQVKYKLILESYPYEDLVSVVFPNELSGQGSIWGIQIDKTNIKTLEGAVFPDKLRSLTLTQNAITTIDNIVFPNSLSYLVITLSDITNIDNAKLPESLTYLDLSRNEIESIDNFAIPPNLTFLDVDNNVLASINNVSFPPKLGRLIIDMNQTHDVKLINPVFNSVISIQGSKIVTDSIEYKDLSNEQLIFLYLTLDSRTTEFKVWNKILNLIQ